MLRVPALQWICGLREVGDRRGCVVYSFGSNSVFDFELSVRAVTACEIHIFDPTSPPPSHGVSQRLNRTGATFFHSVGLGATNGRVQVRQAPNLALDLSPRLIPRTQKLPVRSLVQQLSRSKGIFPVRTLETLMRSLGHWERGIDLLK